MIEHDDTIGTLLKALDDMGIAEQHDRRLHQRQRPAHEHLAGRRDDAFRSEKNTNWEGAFRVPCLVRWPGEIKPGTVTNELMSHNDWIPTLCAIAGEPDIVDKLQGGLHGQRHQLQGAPRRLRPVDVPAQRERHARRTTTARRAPATSSSTPTTTACSSAMRQGDYKYVFAEQRMPGTMGVWAEPFTKLRLQKIFNLFQDPVRAGRHHVQHLLGLAAQPRRQRVRRDGRGLQVRGDVQGVPAALVPAELQPGDSH